MKISNVCVITIILTLIELIGGHKYSRNNYENNHDHHNWNNHDRNWSEHPYSSHSYTIPYPRIDILTPKGFKVSIPHCPGIELIAFHGNLNAPLAHLEAGQFSKDVLYAENGHWTFKDEQTCLKAGDVINYWLYVKKDNLGYRLDGQSFVVPTGHNNNHIGNVHTSPLLITQPTIPQPCVCNFNVNHFHYYDSILNSTTTSTTTSPVTTNLNSSLHKQIEKLSEQLNFTAVQLKSLQQMSEPFQEKIKSLEEVIEDLVLKNNKFVGNKLLLIGMQPPDQNLYEAVRSVIVDKLGLVDLIYNIKTAVQGEGGIIFEMDNCVDKSRILLRAAERLRLSKFRIDNYSDPQATDSTLNIDIRLGE